LGIQKTHNESWEDYLEAILRITQRQGYCRSVDIANQLEVSKPSVSVAMNNLRQAGLIDVAGDKRIELTEQGYEIAERVFARHKFFREKLIQVGVDPETAEREACVLEHAISDDSFEKIRAYLRSCAYDASKHA